MTVCSLCQRVRTPQCPHSGPDTREFMSRIRNSDCAVYNRVPILAHSRQTLVWSFHFRLEEFVRSAVRRKIADVDELLRHLEGRAFQAARPVCFRSATPTEDSRPASQVQDKFSSRGQIWVRVLPAPIGKVGPLSQPAASVARAAGKLNPVRGQPLNRANRPVSFAPVV